MYLTLRPSRAPFGDPRVREAVDLALDRTELLKRALGGRGRVASQIVPHMVAGFDPRIEASRHDPARARRLLEAAGATGATLELSGPNNRYLNDGAVLEEIARQLRLVGLTVNVRGLDKSVFFALATAGDTQMHLIGWSCETADAGDALESIAYSQGDTGIGADNDSGLRDPELDRLIDLANASVSDDERVTRLKVAVRFLNELRVLLPLYVQPECVLVSKRVVFTPGPNFALVPWALRPRSNA
jgi:peptide/nickel transport system substrate-binding protein